MTLDLDEKTTCNSCERPRITTGALIKHREAEVCFDCLLKILKTEQRLFIGANELLTDELRVNWLVRGLVECDSTGQLFGPSGGGKSFVALDLALCIASGQNWNGRPVKRGVVLYLAGEGRTGMRRRVRAWHLSHNSPDLSALFLTQHTVQFDEKAMAKVVRAGQDIEAETGLEVKIIVIDTLARHLCGDENSTREMGWFISVCEDIRSQFPGSSLLIVHHTGNSEEAKTRSRGSSALKAAMDFEICCDKGLLTFTKMKDALQPDPLPFLLRPVPVGFDEDGAEIVSCVVEYGERSQRHVMADLTPNERMLLELVKANQDILIGDLRQLFYTRRKESEPDAKHATLKKAFSRAWEGISSKGFAELKGDTVIGGQGTNGGHSALSPYEGDRGTLGDTPKGVVSPCPRLPVPPIIPPTAPLAALDEFITPEVLP